MNNNYQQTPFRILCLDGGGMKGVYQIEYLRHFAGLCQQKNRIDYLGQPFQMIAGTSTGAFIALCLLTNDSLSYLKYLYQQYGAEIFPYQSARQTYMASNLMYYFGYGLQKGEDALRRILQRFLGQMTVEQMYAQNGVAMCIPALDLQYEAPKIFWTPHRPFFAQEDRHIRLLDIALSTSAAPIVRSIAKVAEQGHDGLHNKYYVDGALWANSPSIFALMEAVEILRLNQQIERPIHLFTLGSPPSAMRENMDNLNTHGGAGEWLDNMHIMKITISAQEKSHEQLSRQVTRLLNNGSFTYRLPSCIDKNSLLYTGEINIDDARPQILRLYEEQAQQDAEHLFSLLPPAGTSPEINTPAYYAQSLYEALLGDKQHA